MICVMKEGVSISGRGENMPHCEAVNTSRRSERVATIFSFFHAFFSFFFMNDIYEILSI